MLMFQRFHQYTIYLLKLELDALCVHHSVMEQVSNYNRSTE